MKLLSCLIVASLCGFLLRGLVAGSPPSPSPAESQDSAVPARTEAGVPLGFPHSPKGAALAAASYQRAFADPAILRPSVLKRRVAVVATPSFRAAMLAANEPGARRLAEGQFGQAARAGIPTAYLGIPVAYRLLSYRPARAVVQTWGFSLLGNVSSFEPTAYFGLARTELVWMGGDWKIAHTRASFGPTPRLGTQRPGGEGLGIVELAEEFESYGVAP